MHPEILFVDDDRASLDSLIRAVADQGPAGNYLAASSLNEARAMVRRNQPLVVVLDLSLEPTRGVESGYDLLREVALADPPCRVIVLTGHGDASYGVRALHLGASSFIQKPADIPHLAALIRDGIAQATLLRQFAALRGSTEDVGLVGDSPAMRQTLQEIRAVAQTNQAVLFLGETGTGKGISARAIHRWSHRAPRRLVRYQPTFATPDMVQSDLFGHVRGAFTGATTDRRGLIAEADGGTLFLDEVDELPRETQVALLGVLQEKTFRPVGSSTEATSNFRLITASNRDLEEAVSQQKLRPDLLHRIAHTVIRIPPLRERLDDIPALVAHILNRLADLEKLTLGGVEDGVIEVLSDYRWPGNVRELEGVIESAAFRAITARRDRIAREDIKFIRAGAPNSLARDLPAQVAAFKRQLIEAALARNGGNQLRAANELGIDRGTLSRILKESR